MSAAVTTSAAARRNAFQALLGVVGESLAWSVSNTLYLNQVAIVNRNLKDSDMKRMRTHGKIDFEPIGMTSIEFTHDGTADNAPAPGHAFADGFGFRHRVRIVGFTDISFLCYCTQSRALTSPTQLPSGIIMGQLIEYFTTDPTTDGLFPFKMNSPALAYKRNGTLFTWNTVTHVWE